MWPLVESLSQVSGSSAKCTDARPGYLTGLSWGSREGWWMWKALKNDSSTMEIQSIRRILWQKKNVCRLDYWSQYDSGNQFSAYIILYSCENFSFLSIRHELLKQRRWPDGLTLSCLILKRQLTTVIKIIIASVMYSGHEFRWWVLLFIFYIFCLGFL